MSEPTAKDLIDHLRAIAAKFSPGSQVNPAIFVDEAVTRWQAIWASTPLTPPPDRVGHLTNKVLINVAGTIAAQWEKFMGWMVAGLAAVLALIIANLDKANGMVSSATLYTAVKLFIAILVLHSLQKIAAVVVASAVAGMEKPALQDVVPPITHAETSKLLDNIEDAYFFPFSCMIHNSFRRMRSGELAHVGRRVVRIALISSLLALVQVGLAVWAVWVIARGLP